VQFNTPSGQSAGVSVDCERRAAALLT
jgi:hypothetical protein